MVSANFPGRPFRLEENVWVRYQDVNANISNVGGELWIRKNSYSPTWSNNRSSFSFFLNGSQVAGWDFTFDFRNSDSLRLAYVEANIGHNGDGTKSFAIDGYCNADALGYTEVHSSATLPTIPRASTLSFTNPTQDSLVAGQSSAVSVARASGGFTHNIDWYFGSASGRAMTGVGASGSWTVPLSTLDQIPNATVGVGKMRTHTYNGGNMIGWTETPFRINAPASVVPTWADATVSENNSAVAAVVGAGRYVQGISKLKGVITGAAGVYSSTITSQTHSVGAETVSGATANFTKPITVAGTAVPVTQKIIDSRGRSKVQTTNINVLPYSTPVLSRANVTRVNQSNAADPVGTRLKISITAAVQSLINSTERNRMTLRVYTKTTSASSWGTATEIVADSSTLTYNSDIYLEGPFSVSTAYDVRVDLVDKFNTTQAKATLTTGEVFQHWGTGMGLGKYWERGMLDVNGDIYHGAGAIVDPLGSIVAYVGTAPPIGWTFCQGQAISRSTYSKLYTLIGNSFGAGNGSSTFNLPDLRGKVIVGVDPNDTDFSRGKTGGAKTHTLALTEIPAHTHGITKKPAGASADGTNPQVGGVDTSNTFVAAQTASAGSGGAHNNLQPFSSISYIIRIL